jgi:hypothetical protein
VFRILFVGIGILLSAFLSLFILARQADEIYVIIQENLKVRESPTLSATPLHFLSQGDFVFSLDRQVQRDGFLWLQVFLLYRPKNSSLSERLDGWVAIQGKEKETFAEREHNLLRKMIVLRNLYKWKFHFTIRQSIKHSRFLDVCRGMVPFQRDKLFHVFVVFLFGSVLFFLLSYLFRTRVSLAFLISVVLSNLIGFLNEVLDLRSKSATFETRDLAANALGSAFILFPLFALLLFRRNRQPRTHFDDPPTKRLDRLSASDRLD